MILTCVLSRSQMVCQVLTSRRYICKVVVYLSDCFGLRSVVVVIVLLTLFLLCGTLLCTGEVLTVNSAALMMASRSNKTEVFIVQLA